MFISGSPAVLSQNKHQQLLLTPVQRSLLERIVGARTSHFHHVERARIALLRAEAMPVRKIAAKLNMHRSKIYTLLNRLNQVGVEKAMDDLPRSGRPASITSEAKIWAISEATRKPTAVGYAQEKWTTRLLTEHLRTRCPELGHISLKKLGQGTLVKLLNKGEIKPHKQRYVLERRDEKFLPKSIELLKAYKLAELMIAFTAVDVGDNHPQFPLSLRGFGSPGDEPEKVASKRKSQQCPLMTGEPEHSATEISSSPKRGRPSKVKEEDRLWALSQFALNPMELGYARKKWSKPLLAEHLHKHCVQSGHPLLLEIGPATVGRIIEKGNLHDGNAPEPGSSVLNGGTPSDYESKLNTNETAAAERMTQTTKQGNFARTIETEDKRESLNHDPETAPETISQPLAQTSESEQQPGVAATVEFQMAAEHQPQKLVSLEIVASRRKLIADKTNAKRSSRSRRKKPTTGQLERQRKSSRLLEELSQYITEQKPQEATDCEVQDARQAQTLDQLIALTVKRRQEGKPIAVTLISYDEKPGIQAIRSKAPDRPPIPGTYPSTAVEFEYERLGTVSLLAGLDLIYGHVHGIVRRRNRSCEFIEFLQCLDKCYPQNMKIVVLLDNHSSHNSQEVLAFLATVPDRFLFVFTPVHSSWLNIIESFFSKVGRSLLAGMRVSSFNDLIERIYKYIEYVNNRGVIFCWRYGLELISA